MDEVAGRLEVALAVGTPVLSSSNTEFGTVEHVLQVPEEDLFDGIAVKTKHGLRSSRPRSRSPISRRPSCGVP